MNKSSFITSWIFNSIKLTGSLLYRGTAVNVSLKRCIKSWSPSAEPPAVQGWGAAGQASRLCSVHSPSSEPCLPVENTPVRPEAYVTQPLTLWSFSFRANTSLNFFFFQEGKVCSSGDGTFLYTNVNLNTHTSSFSGCCTCSEWAEHFPWLYKTTGVFLLHKDIKLNRYVHQFGKIKLQHTAVLGDAGYKD